MRGIERWRQYAHQLKQEVHALALAARDARTPWLARLLIVAVMSYALSPIDLIPDFIPVLGYLDDLVLLPIGIALAIRLIPSDVLEECREVARTEKLSPSVGRGAAVVIVSLWVLAAVAALWMLYGLIGDG